MLRRVFKSPALWLSLVMHAGLIWVLSQVTLLRPENRKPATEPQRGHPVEVELVYSEAEPAAKKA